MKKVIIICIVLIGFLKADDDVLKLVLDVTTSDVGKFQQSVLRGVAKNKAYYESQFKELEVVAMVHGGAYKFFLKDVGSSQFKTDKKLLKISKDIGTRLKALSQIYNVRFLICKAGIDKHNIKEEALYNFVEVIPNAMMGLIDTQNNGFAYVPVR